VKFEAIPIHPSNVGVTVKTEESKAFVSLTAVKEGIGDVIPEVVLKPIAALLVPFQENEVPVPFKGVDAVKKMGEMVVPAQTEISEIASAIGLGFIVIVYDFDGPLHPFIEGVTIMVALIGSLVKFIAVKVGTDKAPVPAAINPILVLLFVQEYCTPDGVPANTIAETVVPLHMVKLERVVEIVGTS
jgi:hypothetical protein